MEEYMEKGFNLQVFELKENIIKVLNDSALPMVTKSTTINELSALLGQYATQAINDDKAAYEAALKEGEKNGN
jgi:MFS-type transporter involved in bile tolerance (Atg22 family)